MTVDLSDEEVLRDTIEWEDIADLIGALSALSAQSGLNLKLSGGILISAGNLKFFYKSPADKTPLTLSLLLIRRKPGIALPLSPLLKITALG